MDENKFTRENYVFPVMVITRTQDPSSDEPPKRVVINYNDSHHRSWLGRHSYWAMKNNYSVTTHNTHEDVTFVQKYYKTEDTSEDVSEDPEE